MQIKIKFPDDFCILGFGGNIGDTEEVFLRAIRMLEKKGFRIEKVSSFFETEAEGCEPEAKPFLNAAVSGFWGKTPLELLKVCQEIEQANGRPKEHPHWVSRTLDIDLILFGNIVMKTDELTLPHPRAGERDFVLLPVKEISPIAEEFLRKNSDC